MSFKQANRFLREGELDEALGIYKKIPKDSPLYNQAQFNIRLIQNKLLGKGNTYQSNLITDQHNSVALVDQPLVSVIMPVFNVAPYLDASILSVLDQTYSNIELIIVDDASTDNGMNIIRMYEHQDSRIKVIPLEFNTLGGAGIPSNIGIDAAKGKYIAFADSDDILNREAIANLVQAAEDNDAEVVIADFCNFNDETRQIELAYDKARWSGLPIKGAFSPQDYPSMFGLSPVPWRKLYKRQLLETNNIRYPEGDYFYEDNPLHWFVLSKAKRVVMLDKEIAYHRMAREGQTMGADTYKLAAHFCHANSITHFFTQSKPVPEVFWEELLKRSTNYQWIIRKVEDERVQNSFKKRNAQLIEKVLTNSEISSDKIKNKYSNAISKAKEYSKAREDIDLTVIIPVYNCADLIQETLSSLTTFEKIKVEVLIMDDGSSDESLSICKSFSENFENLYTFSQKNKGAGVARNALIPLAIGKYTYFLDADDTIDVNNLEEAVLRAKQDSNDLLLFRYKISFFEQNSEREMFNSDQKIWKDLLAADNNSDKKKLSAGLINYPWNRIIATDLLHNENIFFGKTVVHNDVPYHWHSIIAADNIGVFDKAVCTHRKFDEREQITNIQDSRRMMVLEAYRYTNSLISKYKDFSLLLPVWKSFISHLLSWAEERIPNEDKDRYKSRCSEILRELNSLSNKDKDTNIVLLDGIDTQVGFYRIIGNNISGLHAQNQSIENLKHILDFESNLKNIKKYFVINRVVDDSLKSRLLEILKDRNIEYIDINFDINEFKQQGYDFNSLPDSYYWFSKKKDKWAGIVANTAIRNFKNAYLMNNNGARNVALQHGRSRFDWVMPWDGNCFLSDDGFNKLLLAMSDEKAQYKYIATPMQRAVESDVVDRFSVATNAVDEPQLSFRKDAKETFNEDRVYGNQSKVELFKRLGYKGEAWDRLINLYPWRELTFEKSPDQGRTVEASSVFRLYSGNTSAAVNGEKRSHTRSFGVIEMIDSTEAKYVETNFSNFNNKEDVLSSLTKLVSKAKAKKIAEDIASEQSSTINKVNSKDRVYGVIYGFSKGMLKPNVASTLNTKHHYFTENIDLSNVDKFSAVLNNLTSALICSLVAQNYNKAVKVKLDLAMLMNYYHSNLSSLEFNKSTHHKHITQLMHIVKILFLEVFEYSFEKNFAHALSVSK